MRLPLACVLTCVVGFQPLVVCAQQGAASSAPVFQIQPPAPAPTQARPSPPAGVPVVSLDRIKRALRQLPPSTVKTALRLEYYVEVQGVAPPISIFEEGELSSGRVPYAAPSYVEMRQVMTPAEFRAPVVSISSLTRGGTRSVLDRSSQRARARRAEDAKQKAAEAEHERQQKLKDSVVVSPPK